MNGRTEALFGYPRAELIGDTLEKLMPARFRALHGAHVSGYLRDPQSRPMGAGLELCGRHQDGRELPLEISLSPLRTEYGLLLISSIRDVTQRRQATEALRESEERLRSAFAYSPIPKALVDLSGRFRQVNRALCEFTGYSEEELLGLDFPAISHPEDLPADLEGLHRLLEGTSASFRIENRYRHKQGHTLWGRLSVSVVRDRDGRPLHFIRQIQDVTEQRLAEEALRRSEALYRTLSEMHPDFVWTLRPDGSPGYRNRRWREYTGLVSTDGVALDQVIHSDEAPLWRERWARSFAERASYEAEARIRRRDGEYRWFLHRAEPLTSADGCVREWVGTSTDITDQKRAADLLRQQNELLALSHDAIIVHDPDGHVQLWNRGAEQTYGFTADEALGNMIHSLLQTRLPDSQAVTETLLREGDWEGELTHTAKDGSIVIVMSRQVLRRDQTGGIHAILEINRDITLRKKIEAERDLLLESEQRKTEQLTAAIREAHHRIKNNLQAVTDLLSIELDAALNTGGAEPLRDSIERIQAIGLVHDLLSQDAEMESVDLRELVERLAPTVLRANTRNSTEVKLALTVSSRSLSSKQATALALVLNELISNASKHAFPGRTTGLLQVSLRESDGQLLLFVQDDGPGLPDGFDLEHHANVGLQVTQTLVRGSLRGQLTLHPGPGLRAEVRFDPETW